MQRRKRYNSLGITTIGRNSQDGQNFGSVGEYKKAGLDA
jgi:hypothetical protein